MRISDWSSDVCSSDLLVDQQQFLGCSRRARHRLAGHEHDRREDDAPQFLAACEIAHLEDGEIIVEREARLACKEPAVASAAAEGRDRGGEIAARLRSDERRVGKEWVSTGRSRW